jgi:2,3-bisphosphoglycerate-dependent phosphoglycerate mutase
MVALILLRHGESLWNSENRFTGWTDVDLSPRGIDEAHRAAELLKEGGYTFRVAYTSVLKRAIRTLWIVMDDLDLMYVPVHRSWRPPPLPWDDQRHPRFDPRYADLDPESLPATESLHDTLKRVLPCWESHITEDLRQGKPVLVAAHGNSLRALVKHLDGTPDDEIAVLNIPTGYPLIYELDGDLKAVKHYYLGDPEEIAAAAQGVARQAGAG